MSFTEQRRLRAERPDLYDLLDGMNPVRAYDEDSDGLSDLRFTTYGSRSDDADADAPSVPLSVSFAF